MIAAAFPAVDAIGVLNICFGMFTEHEIEPLEDIPFDLTESFMFDP